MLVSWALPRGLPDDPRQNRLAIHTEDHPLEYLTFEGDIPAGAYGAGTMSIWDRGTYVAEKFDDDKVVATLTGERIHATYALFETANDWLIHRMDSPGSEGEPMPHDTPAPGTIEPMTATPSELPDDDDGWAFEIKWDGVRALAYSDSGTLRLISRTGRDITRQYPEIDGLARTLGAREAVFDGEIVAFDDEGRPNFQLLQPRMHVTAEAKVRERRRAIPVTYVIFDLLHLDGRSLMGRPYVERRRQLDELGLEGAHWHVPDYHRGDGLALLDATRQQGLEGLVAKHLDSPYRPGRRSRDWRKVKNVLRQEFIVGGWTEGSGSRSDSIGALLIGYYDDAQAGQLRYAGKVGTGFDAHVLGDLRTRLARLERSTSPFTGRQPPNPAVFVEPELVCEVEFRQWTKTGTIRQAAYRGLRDDKLPREVFREQTAPAPDDVDASAEVDRSTGADGSDDADAWPGNEKPDDTEPGDTDTPAGTKKPGENTGPGHSTEPGAADAAAGTDPAGRDTARLREGPNTVGGRSIKLSNLDKVMYPAAGLTKGDVIEFYRELGPAILPHLSGHPLTMKRYPDGVTGEHFFEKRCPSWRPDWVHTATIPSESAGGTIDYCVVDDLPTLVWVANLASLELHTLLGTAADVDCPSMVVFDLDPGEGVGVAECAWVAVRLRDVFDHLGLTVLVKSSGSKGLHLAVPLNTPTTFGDTKPFAHAIAQLVEQEHPDDVVSRMAKARRRGKVFVDWSQNSVHKTTVAPFSLRARTRPTVSVPLSWAEVEAVAGGDAEPSSLLFEAPAVLEQLESRAKLFQPLLDVEQHLPDPRG